MRMISPDVEDVALRTVDVFPRFVSSRYIPDSRVPYVKIGSFAAAVSLRALGDGVNRVFGIVLALVRAKDGLLLVDEMENGIHYSVQPDLWRMVFEMATRLNVRIFATTHNYDCIKAFEEAARGSEKEFLSALAGKATGRSSGSSMIVSWKSRSQGRSRSADGRSTPARRRRSG